MAEVVSSDEEGEQVKEVGTKIPVSTQEPKEARLVRRAQKEAKVPPNRKRPAHEPLPYGWVRKASKTKKGAYYYAHILTGKTQVNRPGPRATAGKRPRAERAERAPPPQPIPEEVRQRQAEHDAAAEAELEEVKRKEESGSDDDNENVTGEDLTKWKQEEELREKKQAEREEKDRLSWPAASELPPVPRVLQPCLDVLKDGKWVDRHVLGSDKQRWTLGRAAGEVDFPMNHTTISRQHAALTRGGAGIYLVDQSVHGVQVNAQRIEKNLRVLLKDGAMVKFGASSRLYVYHEPT
ncbi:unnamed protein product [Symbiodinium natans]|uniref:FHA domain-containing protein n=1 Tax=Symbiodinium natans TaxID=878477 RepID=A0A812QPL4_9DINO|nr:unnamed protein product [Symbiodinium natans]